MQKKDLYAMGIALLVAILATMIARFLFAPNQVRVVQAPPKVIEKKVELPTSQVLVAKDTLPIGTRLDNSQITWQKWPSDALDPNYAAKNEQGNYVNPQLTEQNFIGKISTQLIVKGAPIQMGLFSANPVKEQGVVTQHINPKMRAVTLPIDAASFAGRLVFPGDIVDIFIHAKEKGTTLNVNKVKILAIDNDLDKLSMEQNFNKNPKNITLEVRPEHIPYLIHDGRENGVIVILRNNHGENNIGNLQITQDKKNDAHPKDLKDPKDLKKVEEKKVEKKEITTSGMSVYNRNNLSMPTPVGLGGDDTSSEYTGEYSPPYTKEELSKLVNNPNPLGGEPPQIRSNIRIIRGDQVSRLEIVNGEIEKETSEKALGGGKSGSSYPKTMKLPSDGNYL